MSAAVLNLGVLIKDDKFITGLDKHIFERKIVNIFLPVSFNMCFEYPQHMF